MSFWNWLTGRPPFTPPGTVLSPWADSSALSAALLQNLFDLQVDQLPISRATAMSIPAVRRARNVLCGTAAGLPLIAQRVEGPLAPQPAITQQIDPGRPNEVTIAWIIDELIFYGAAYLVIVQRDAASNGGRPSGMRIYPQDQITFDSMGRPVSVDGWTPAMSDWVRIDGLVEGVLVSSRKALRAAADLADAAGRAARNPVPSVELHQTTAAPTLTDEQIEKLKTDWVNARTGKYGGVAFTPLSIQAVMHGQAAEQLLIAGRQESRLEMANIMGVPGWVVEAQQKGSSLTYSNIESRVQELLDFGLAPLLSAIEGRLSMPDILPRGTWARFDTAGAVAGNLKTRSEAYLIAEQAGIMTSAEARATERGITPREGEIEDAD